MYNPNILLAVQYGALLARSGMCFMDSQLLVHGAHMQPLPRVAEFKFAVQHDNSYFFLVYNKCDTLLRKLQNYAYFN
jgi:hypothetical protein